MPKKTTLRGQFLRTVLLMLACSLLVGLISLPLSICCHIGDGALGVACAKVW